MHGGEQVENTSIVAVTSPARIKEERKCEVVEGESEGWPV